MRTLMYKNQMTEQNISIDKYDLEFTPEEREGIKAYAKKLASLGESAVNEFVNTRNCVAIMWMQSYVSEPDEKRQLSIKKMMDHQNFRFDSIIGQARMILQIEGRDSMSILNDAFKRAGWGSMYEEGTKAHEHMKGCLEL